MGAILALVLVPLTFSVQQVIAVGAANPDADPRLEEAVAWATRQMGTAKLWLDDGVSLCDQFVENAYGVTAQYPTAYDMYLALGRADATRTTVASLGRAPAGAIVFFDRNSKNGENGHVGIYIGSGQFIGVVSSGKVKQLGVQWWNDNASKFLSWTFPRDEWPGASRSTVISRTTAATTTSKPAATATLKPTIPLPPTATPKPSPTPEPTAPPKPLPAPSTQALADATKVFQAQWQTEEAIARNLWGPSDGAPKQEPYDDAPGDYRLVQYYDKGRMELTDPKTGKVTNGLLATELITGKIQIGNDAYETRTPAAIPVAGDADNPGPTYAALGGKAAKVLAPVTANLGKGIALSVSATGDVSETIAADNRDPRVAAKADLTLAVYDSATKHNVPATFAAYRDKVGTPVTGYAKSEPFLTTVKIGGVPRQVVVQVFERRVLTYNVANADPYKIEMGNIGQHYERWRYGG
jgi:hypothetical protein